MQPQKHLKTQRFSSCYFPTWQGVLPIRVTQSQADTWATISNIVTQMLLASVTGTTRTLGQCFSNFNLHGFNWGCWENANLIQCIWTGSEYLHFREDSGDADAAGPPPLCNSWSYQNRQVNVLARKYNSIDTGLPQPQGSWAIPSNQSERTENSRWTSRNINVLIYMAQKKSKYFLWFLS